MAAVGHEGQQVPGKGAGWWVRDLVGAAIPSGRDRQMDMLQGHATAVQKQLVPVRDRQIGTLHKVRLDLYLVGYGGKGEEVKKNREREKLRGEERGLSNSYPSGKETDKG